MTDDTAQSRPRGRPSVPADERRSERIELRTTAALRAKAERLATADGITVSAWLERRIVTAR